MLQSIGIYVLKVTAASGLLFLYYHIALRNKRFHYYNRFYLLLSVAVSIVLPFMHVQWLSFKSSSPQAIKLYNLMYSNTTEINFSNDSSSLSMQQLTIYALVAVSITLFVLFLLKIKKLYSVKKQYPVQNMQEFDFITTDLQQAPFSFMKNIFWRNDIPLNDITGRQIFNHEVVHVQQKHSWDKLLMQTVLCLFWMNPFFWLIRKELYLVHEFIADEKSIEANDTAAFAEMLLAAQFGRFRFLPAQSFYFSLIKRRLIMLTTSKKSRFSYLRRLMVLPLLVVVIGLFAFSIRKYSNEAINTVANADGPFTLIVNAGHGGKDFGAASDGLYEKDIALKIAKKIKELAAQYNIDVLLTRSDDTYMPPPGITGFSATHNAGAFIAIHINASADKDSSGFEIVVSKSDRQYIDKSKLLASAILQDVSSDFKVNQSLMQKQVGIWVLDHNTKPSALIECGYMSNSNDLKILQDEKNMEKIAANILKGVAVYANNNAKIHAKNNITPSTGNMGVMIGKKVAFPGEGVTQEADSVFLNVDKQHQPLYVVDGREVSGDVFRKMQATGISYVNVWRDSFAIAKYGNKGKNGVIEVTLKAHPGKLSDTIPEKQQPTEKVFTQVQQMPSYKGGAAAWNKFLEKNLRFESLDKKKAPVGTYIVTVSFKVDDKGNISDIKALNDPGYETGKEACRVVTLSTPWNPGMQNNIPVTAMMKQKIVFSYHNKSAL